MDDKRGLPIPPTDPQYQELISRNKLWPALVGDDWPEAPVNSGELVLIGPGSVLSGSTASVDVSQIRGRDGRGYFVRPKDGYTITFKHGQGNVLCAGGADIEVSDEFQICFIQMLRDIGAIVMFAQGLGGTTVAHNPITLGASIDANLASLSGQVLDLDTQSANRVFAGPGSGPAAAPNFRALVSADLPASVVETTDADYIDLTDGGTTTLHNHGASGYGTFADEGTDITQRAKVAVYGKYLQALDDAANTRTKLIGGAPLYDAIVDSDEWIQLTSTAGVVTGGVDTLNDAGQAMVVDAYARCSIIITGGTGAGQVRVIASNTATQFTTTVNWATQPDGTSTYLVQPANPVYRRIREAIDGGATSILYRKSSGETDITIANSDSVYYIAADKPNGGGAGATDIEVNFTVNKSGVILFGLQFAGNGKLLTLNSLGVTAVGCIIGDSSVSRTTGVVLSAAGTSLIECAFVARTGAVSAVSIQAADCRVQACQFVGNGNSVAHIITTAAGSRASITGNLFLGFAETGYFIDLNAASSFASINGNLFDMATGQPGAIRCNDGVLHNIAGNAFNLVSSTAGNTYNYIAGGPARGVVGNNVFQAPPTLGAGTTLRMIQGSGSVIGMSVNGNVFLFSNRSTTTVTLQCAIEVNTAGAIIIGNNFMIPVVTATGFVTGLNALVTDYIFEGNSFTGTSQISFQGWKPIHNSAGAAAIGPKSIIRNNPGLPTIEAYAAVLIEDFVFMNASAVAAPLVAATHNGWVSVVNGVGAGVTNNIDTRNGTIEMNTGAVSGNDACVYLNTDHIVVNNQSASWQVNIPTITSVAAVRIRVGFMARAQWAAHGAIGAFPPAGVPNDYFILEFDTASGISAANWVMRWRTGGGAEQTFNTGVAAVAGSTQLLMGVDRNSSNRPWAYVNGQFINPNVAATGIGATLMTIGIFLETLANADKEIAVDTFIWGDARI